MSYYKLFLVAFYLNNVLINNVKLALAQSNTTVNNGAFQNKSLSPSK